VSRICWTAQPLATRHEATEHGSIIKFIDQLFLDTFGLARLNELYKEGRMEEVFSSVYSGEMGASRENTLHFKRVVFNRR
jgi:hypothetical protein